jgi:aspartyl-tRNA(Asn)/glutamyl-tRNA(Gln) amidotransferase subunit A
MLRRGDVSPLELVRDSLGRIERDASLGAYITVCARRAIDEARAAERRRGRGPLYGLPFAVKDNIDVAGVRTTGGTRGLPSRIPRRDAPAWAALRRAGAICVGKTSMHELAYAGPHPAFPIARNPHDRRRAPGGSSSGSAVAVAAGHVIAAVGTDTGGSVRQPAAYCGIFGLKPTNEVISVRGVLPLAPSLDTIGLLARDLDAMALCFAVLVPGARAARASRIIVGIATDGAVVRRAARQLSAAGIRCGPVDLPDLAELHRHHRVVLRSEALDAYGGALARHSHGFGRAFRDALLGTPADGPAALGAARRARRAARSTFRRLLARHRVLVLPAAPGVAPRMDTATGRAHGRDLTRWTFIANFVGLPAISVPCGVRGGLPLAVQLVGRPGDERLLFTLAAAIR